MKRNILTITIIILILAFTQLANAQWKNGMSGSFILGQPELNKWHQGKVSQTDFSSPTDIAIDFQNNKLYIADRSNNRVLRFEYPVTENQPKAEIVFGQRNFDTKSANLYKDGGIGANSMNGPYGVVVHKGTLWVSDQGNNRVLRFDNAHLRTTNAPEADGVLGQPNFKGSKNTSQQPGMSSPTGIAIDSNGNLFVAQSGTDGIYIYKDAKNKANGSAADGLLGRERFDNYPPLKIPVSPSVIDYCEGMAIDKEGRLFVADWGYNRVLWFNDAANKVIGAPADGVVCQKDFYSTDTATTNNRLFVPRAVAISPAGTLFIADAFNNRILIFNDIMSKPKDPVADYVIGQTDFVTKTKHYTADKMSNPHGIAITPNGQLFVAEYSNNRVMVFNGSDESGNTSSINYTYNNQNVSVYPNPATSIINLSCEVTAGDLTADFKLMNLEGTVVQSERIDFVATGTNIKRIELNKTLGSGTYVYSLEFGKSKYSGKVNIVR